MALAQAKQDCSFRYQISPQMKNKGRKQSKKSRSKSWQNYVLVFGCVLICFALGLSVVAQTAKLNAKGYQLNQLQAELLNLGRETDVLRLKIAKMSSLARIESIAVTELGMQKPGANDWGILPERQRVEFPVQIAETVRPLSTNHNSVFGIMNKLLSRWLGPGTPAKASE